MLCNIYRFKLNRQINDVRYNREMLKKMIEYIFGKKHLNYQPVDDLSKAINKLENNILISKEYTDNFKSRVPIVESTIRLRRSVPPT